MQYGKFDLSTVVPIVGEGAIAHPDIADGRMIPVLIVDCAEHQALYELILVHETTPPGDASLRWGRRILDKKHVYLTMEFSRPVPTSIAIRFALAKQGSIVDHIIDARGVYLQPLQSGTRVSEGLDKPKILVEVPASATFPEWKTLFYSTVVRAYRESGASKSDAKFLAREHIDRLSEMWGQRQKRQNPQ